MGAQTRTLALWAPLAICLATVACSDRDAGRPAVAATGSLRVEVSYPTSAAYDPSASILFVGSYGDGSVQRVAARGKVPAAMLTALPRDGRRHVLRIRVDTQHRDCGCSPRMPCISTTLHHRN